MDHNPDRIVLWPGYFDAKNPRRAGRRVPKDAAVKNPDLEGLILAARTAGVKKMKREERISHPKRPHALEGRLWLSRKGARESIGTSSKEEIMQIIGGVWQKMHKDAMQAEKISKQKGPSKGDRRARSQRKVRNNQRKRR